MPAYNFKPRFEAAVASGRKRQTIRRKRKDGHDARPGQTAYLFVLMRTKRCREIGRGEIASVDPITLGERRCTGLAIRVNGRLLTDDESGALARADGFASVAEMRAFFAGQYGLPFSGLLIAWNLTGGGNS